MTNQRESNHVVGSKEWEQEKINMSYPELVKWYHELTVHYHAADNTLKEFRQSCKGLLPITIVKEIGKLIIFTRLYDTDKARKLQYNQKNSQELIQQKIRQSKEATKEFRKKISVEPMKIYSILFDYIFQNFDIALSDDELIDITLIAKSISSTHDNKENYSSTFTPIASYGI